MLIDISKEDYTKLKKIKDYLLINFPSSKFSQLCKDYDFKDDIICANSLYNTLNWYYWEERLKSNILINGSDDIYQEYILILKKYVDVTIKSYFIIAKRDVHNLDFTKCTSKNANSIKEVIEVLKELKQDEYVISECNQYSMYRDTYHGNPDELLKEFNIMFSEKERFNNFHIQIGKTYEVYDGINCHRRFKVLRFIQVAEFNAEYDMPLVDYIVEWEGINPKTNCWETITQDYSPDGYYEDDLLDNWQIMHYSDN